MDPCLDSPGPSPVRFSFGPLVTSAGIIGLVTRAARATFRRGRDDGDGGDGGDIEKEGSRTWKDV